MDDWQTVLAGGSISAIVLTIVGKWVVPILRRMLDNIAGNIEASGDLVTQLRAERDHWKDLYKEVSGKMDEVRGHWLEMSRKYDVLELKLEQAEKRSRECDEHYAKLKLEMAAAKQRIAHLERGAPT